MTQAVSSPAPVTQAGVAVASAAAPAARLPERAWLAILFLAGIAVFSPSLRASYLLDDYLHASMIRGTFPAPRNPLDLYNFVSDADRALLLERGMLPWWSDPGLTLRFLRPLSSALLWVDHRLVGERPLLLHLHSLVWWAAVVLGAREIFRRHLAPRPARIATAVFALAPCHALPLAWLANRDVLISLAYGLPGLGAYLRFREARRLRDAALAAVLFSLSLLGGEYAFCLAGYVLAFEVTARRERLFVGRVAGLLPFALPAAGYLYARRALHYGTLGSGFYTDPFREPASFLGSMPRRLATLALEGWFSLDTETLTPDTPWWVLALALAAGVALVALPLRRAIRGIAGDERRAASWMLPGSILAMGPVLAVVPSPRLLGASMLGIAAGVGWVLDRAWFPAAPEERRGAADLAGTAALVIGFAQLVHGPATAWLVARHFRASAATFAANAEDLRARVGDPASAEVVVVRGLGGSFFMPFGVDPGVGPPARWRIFAQTGHVLAIRRDARTLELVVPQGQGAFPKGAGNLYRNEHTRVGVGDVYDVQGMRVTVLEMGAAGPRAVRFEMDRVLESLPLVWVAEDYQHGFPDAPPPQEGFGKPFDP
jgi:hypothetical protein